MKRKDYTMRAEIRDNRFFTAVKIVFKCYDAEGDTLDKILMMLFKNLDRLVFTIKADHVKNRISIIGIVDNSLIAGSVFCLLRERMLDL